MLTYPELLPDVEPVVRRVASQTVAELIDIRVLFDAELRKRPRGELFIPDDHCADDGYAIMGKAAAELAVVVINR